jgi:hypothetical protein
MQVFFPAIEPHVNTVASAVLSEPGMKRLMDVADKVSDEPKCNASLIARCVG